jgi:hypothetical protein
MYLMMNSFLPLATRSYPAGLVALRRKKGENNECNQQCAGNGSSQRDKNLSDLEMLSGSEASGGRITLDVKDLTLVDQYAISLPERYKPATSSSRIAHHTSVSGSR